jgi:hypothetical protein
MGLQLSHAIAELSATVLASYPQAQAVAVAAAAYEAQEALASSSSSSSRNRNRKSTAKADKKAQRSKESAQIWRKVTKSSSLRACWIAQLVGFELSSSVCKQLSTYQEHGDAAAALKPDLPQPVLQLLAAGAT